MNSFDIKIPSDQLKVIQIVAGALPLGAIIFLVIAITVVKPLAVPLNFDLGIMAIVFLVQAAALIPASVIVPEVVLRATAAKTFANVDLRQEIEQESMLDEPPKQINNFMNIYMSKTIIGAALLEGLALFGIVAYIIDESMITLIGAGIIILSMFALIPTLSRVQNRLASLVTEMENQAGRSQ